MTVFYRMKSSYQLQLSHSVCHLKMFQEVWILKVMLDIHSMSKALTCVKLSIYRLQKLQIICFLKMKHPVHKYIQNKI